MITFRNGKINSRIKKNNLHPDSAHKKTMTGDAMV